MKPFCRSNRNLLLCISWLKTSRCCRNLLSVSDFQTTMPVSIPDCLVIITNNLHWVWHKPSKPAVKLETCMFSHELMQGSYHLLAVKLFYKVVSFDNCHRSIPGLWESSVEWLQISLGWCEMATPELQTPSARVAPASYSPVKAVCSSTPTIITDNIRGVRGAIDAFSWS